jgi:hypothetical protein
MKTQIIRLDGYDDITSACDKLTWGKTGRIVVVWPERGHPLDRRLDLVLLQRRSRELGAQLALVTRVPRVRSYAGELGIPVFRKLEKAERGAWRGGRRKPAPWPERRGFSALRAADPQAGQAEHRILNSLPVRLVFFTLAILAMLGLAASVLPSATVRMALPQTAQKIRWQGQAAPAGRTSAIPLHTTEMVVEARETRQTSGQVRAPLLAASGTARFTNLTTLAVAIPAGTVISTGGADPVRYETVGTAQAPAGVGESVDVFVRALLPGPAGNLAKNSLTALEGAAGVQLTVSNPAPTSGGTERVYPAPDDADRAALKKSILETLRKAALGQAKAQLPDGAVLIGASLTEGEVIDDQSFPPDRQPSDRLEQSIRARYTIDYLEMDDLRKAAAAALDAALPAGYHAAGGPVQVSLAADPLLAAGGAVDWQINAVRQIEPIIPTGEAARLVRGRQVTQAAAALISVYHLAVSPTIQMAPQWWPWLPFLTFRIEVTGG